MDNFRKIINLKKWQSLSDKSSKSFRRINQFESEKRIKKIVKRGLLILLIIYLGYLFFFSRYFAITNINIAVENSDFNITEFNNYLKEILNKKLLLIIPRNNYFLFSKKYIENELKKNYIVEELSLEKKFPKTLNIYFKERIANLLYQTNEKIYLIDLNGNINSQVGERIILNEKRIPKITDESNSDVILNQNVITPSLISLIIDLYQKFNDYLPNLTIKSFKITSPNPTFVKVVTVQGPEIHLNDRLSLEEQLTKLKRSLESEMIDLTKIQYINLRIKDQVIYK